MCDLSNLLFAETVGTAVFSKDAGVAFFQWDASVSLQVLIRDTDTYGLLCVLPREARTPPACAEKIAQRSKVTIKCAL